MNDSPLFGDARLPDVLDARVRAELEPSEQLLWVGQPHPGRFGRMAIPLVLFGIPWTAFAVFWVAMASGPMFFGAGGANNAGPGVGGFFVCFPLFGLPFILIGLFFLTSPYWLRRKAKRTCYALTDRRAILWEAGMTPGSMEVRSYRPADFEKMFRRDFPDGSGDLMFEEPITVQRSSGRYATFNTQGHGFMGIENVREIEKLLRKELLPEQVQ